LEQVNQITQSNTASAEESAAAAEELSAQAQQLKATVARFKLRKKSQEPVEKDEVEIEPELELLGPIDEESLDEPEPVMVAASGGNGHSSQKAIVLDDDDFGQF
jgi:methyl-accepting chemotaxis protein